MEHQPRVNFAADFAAQYAAVRDWWLDAGVDYQFSDAAKPWLADKQTPSEPVAPISSTPHTPAQAIEQPALPAIGGDPTTWPTDLIAFHDWWLTEPSLDHGQTAHRISPRGPQAPALMVIIPEPEAEDQDALLSGPQGQLLSAMLAAMGVGTDQCYIASALPRHTPLADWPGLTAGGMGAVLLHHINLVQPQRLILFGATIPPLLRHSMPQNTVPALETGLTLETGQDLPIIPARDLGFMLKRGAAKAAFWQQWLDL
ncbi:MAG: hypothetical protein RLY97_1372 [Pseudomonadota bacterium]